MKARNWVAASLAAGMLFGGSAHATVVTLVIDNVGPVTEVDAGSPEATAGFQLGENIIAEITFDDATPDVEPSVGDGNFDDPNGFITLIGATSGASITYLGGLEIEVDDNEEFEFETLLVTPNATVTNIVGNDIDLDTSGTAFFTDPDNLAAVVADLLANPFPNASTDAAFTSFFDGTSTVTGMRFGAAPASVTVTQANDSVVPTPVPALLMGLGLLGLGHRRITNSKRN